MVRSPDCVTDFFDIVTGVLETDTLSPFLIIICQDYMQQTSLVGFGFMAYQHL